MALNLRQLEAFHWIYLLGSFHAAARHLGTSQAAISIRIRDLERDLGVTLFERHHDGVRATSKGVALAPHAARMLALAGEVQALGSARALSGRVRFGATGVHALTWLPELLRRVSAETPEIVVELAIETSEVLHDMLERGRLDIALLAGPVADARLLAEPVGPIPNAWLASPRLGLDARCTPAALASRPIISDRAGSRLHAAVMAWFRVEGCDPACHHGASHLHTRLHLAQQGVGVALAGRAAAMRSVRQGVLMLIETPRPAPSLDYVLASADTLSPAVRHVRARAATLVRQRPDLDTVFVEAGLAER